ncbi:putative bifunctional UDP-N-acetylglucosamine transferase and deubiquitinase ALG13 [Epinephelus moara]|uniref:putative bifunctional UDP-N-acetylglucosamine transferase and deubiquitinase ALG13 n=1 Tax=Epinephelus moara TaxID=300413 RepID=UPI00214E9C0A|nr:putative bifunctional UDP-N-acetylglucosamine transferase and deubiquitinase ALG13 [Epinephelus moara]
MHKGLKKYFVNMDEFLSSLGLYRKMVARDASSLFRAVSEQLYYSQNYHQRIRQDCANFMRANRCNFEPVAADSVTDAVTDSVTDSVTDTVTDAETDAVTDTVTDTVTDAVTDTVTDAVTDAPPAEAPPPSRLSLPFKVMKSLDGDVYRNLEFDVWQDTCKEMQKTDYMVFAGRQYFLGDKCQVRLEPKGKYYNAFIQEVGTHSSAVTVFIEELGEKHLVPLTDLKPVNPVPAWNVAAPTRKGDMDSDSRGQRHHRHRYFRKSRGSSGVKGGELLMSTPSTYGGPAPSALPPRFQPAGHPRPPPPPSPGAMTYDAYIPPHHHHPITRPPRYGATRSSSRFLNRHLIGPQLTYYHPGRRYYHDYENYAFRSRRSRRQLAAALNKECQFGFSADTVEEPTDLDTAITYYQLDDTGDAVFPPLPGPAVAPPPSITVPPPPAGPSYRVQRGSGPLPSAPPPGNTPVCSSEEDQEDASTLEDQAEYTEEYIYMTQDQSYQTSDIYTAAEPSANQDEQEGETADSPPRPEMNYSYTQQVVKPLAVICSSPSSSSSSPSSPSSRVTAAAHLPTTAHTQTRSVAMAIPAASPWLMNELGEPLCTMVTPPPYSYDPNGSDLPRDCRVLQYYFNLGVQWYHQSCWQQQQQQQVYPATSPEASYPYQHYTPYLSQELPLHGAPPSYSETSRGPHQPPPSYPESTRPGDGQTDGHSSGPTPSMDTPSSSISPAPPGSTPSSAHLYPDPTPLPPPPLLHLPYEAPPPATYLSSAPPPPLPHSAHPHSAHLTHHSSYHACLPPSAHWGQLQTGGHTTRVYCPAPGPAHVVGYITAPPPHHAEVWKH